MATILKCDRCGSEINNSAGTATSFSKATLDQRSMGKGSCTRDLCRGCTIALESWLVTSPPVAVAATR